MSSPPSPPPGGEHPAFRLPTVRIDHLYVLLGLSAATIAVSLMPVPPNDFWWHLRVGQLIAEHGRIPETNLFAWSIPTNTPHVYAAWLGEWLLYLVFAAGGSSLLFFTRNLLALALFSIIALEAHRRSGSWKLGGLAVALAAGMGINNVVVRPQIWSWVPFGLFVLILRRYCDRALHPGWLGALPVLMAFWVNVHGSFVLGLALLGGVAVGEALRCLARQPGALRWQELAWLYGAVAAATGATMINPQGIGIFTYVHDLMTDPPSHRFVTEWRPPTPSDPPNIVFYGSILLLLLALAYTRVRPSPTDLVLTCGFLWLAWSGMRYVFWFGPVAMPFLAQCLAKLRSSPSAPAYPRQWGLANSLIATLLVIPMVLAQPWFLHSLPLPEEYRRQMLGPPAPPLLDTETPFAATEYLRSSPGGHLFNEMGYGSYLIWALPEQAVFIDPRVELYPLKQWEDYLDISYGRKSTELLKLYGADRVLLSLKAQPALSKGLAEAPGWQREYADQWSEIWRYRAPE